MKVPTPKKTNTGIYRIQLRLGGQSIVITDKNEKTCIRKAEKVKADYRNGLAAMRYGDLTLRQAIDAYIESKSNVLSPSTLRGYRYIQKMRFQSVMDAPLGKTAGWQRILNSEAASVSPKTLRNAWGLITAVMRANEIAIPNVTLPQVVREDRPFLEPEQIPVFLKAIEGCSCELAALLALHGLRRSELLALTKDDIKRGTIHVRGAVVVGEGNVFVHKKTNKNAASARNVPVMIPRLSQLVSAAPDGALITQCPTEIYKHINAVCEASGLPPVGIHGLRHTFASLCYHLQIPQRQAMELGGWSNAATMDKIYTHLAQSDRQKAKDKLATFFEQMP